MMDNMSRTDILNETFKALPYNDQISIIGYIAGWYGENHQPIKVIKMFVNSVVKLFNFSSDCTDLVLEFIKSSNISEDEAFSLVDDEACITDIELLFEKKGISLVNTILNYLIKDHNEDLYPYANSLLPYKNIKKKRL